MWAIILMGAATVIQAIFLAILARSEAGNPDVERLKQCGNARYLTEQYTCYNSSFLCPIIDGKPTLRCGSDCYSPASYSCESEQLISIVSSGNPPGCSGKAATLHLTSLPYENYFYSDCHSAAQVVVTSPQSDSNLTYISPRILVAWPGGNSGVLAYLKPSSGVNGTLSIGLTKSSIGTPLRPIYQEPASPGGNATVGVRAVLDLSSPAVLDVAILGSVRTIRDFTEGPSILHPEIQDPISYSATADGGVSLTRLWLDNITTTTLAFHPFNGGPNVSLSSGKTVSFPAGQYILNASYNYPQLTQLSIEDVLNSDSQDLIAQQPNQTSSLSFLTYTSKITTGAWRFLTYFGRDSMISALLLEPVLSLGENSAMEAVLAGVLERINRTDGSACHEETIGDYATWLNLQDNITSTEPLCDYKMIDTDLFLPPLLDKYLVKSPTGSSRAKSFLGTKATVLPVNKNLLYADLARINAEKIMNITAPFASGNGQTIANMIALKPGEVVGEWRDSTYGLGGGTVPYDVNTALVPAALRAIASLSNAGYFPTHPEWATTAAAAAQIWEDSTLEFFEVELSQSEARSRLSQYLTYSNFSGSSQASTIDSPLIYHALSLNAYNLPKVEVMNTDDCFRHFLLNTTNQAQLTRFINSTANNVRRTFPAGLMTTVSMVVANPAYGPDPVYAQNFTTSAYHGTVVWSWPLAMMARGLELQLSRCNDPVSSRPDFCADLAVHNNVKAAYNVLWDSIESNSQYLSTEVWSWTLSPTGNFNFIELGELPPPNGEPPTESNIVQLWSLTFLAVGRNKAFA